MKKFSFLLLSVLWGCQSITPPKSFIYKEIQTDTYKLASWQKITNAVYPVRIYIEGDGHAFNRLGYPTSDPTPLGTFLREIAFNDPNANVVYLARPCQYVKDDRCSVKDWTTGRFSEDIVKSAGQAIKKISGKNSVILIGYSGGALLSGLVIDQNPQLSVKKWITLAGMLNHSKWTQELNLPPLKDSVDLDKLPKVKQLHLVGDKDRVIPWRLTESLVDKNDLIIIPNATHDRGYNDYYTTIYR
jgi:pimeloyl-ACP methyl ester carboxylesterase